MKYLIYLIMGATLLTTLVRAEDIAQPPPDKDLSVETKEYLKKIADNFNNLTVTVTRPDGNRTGNYGDMVGWATEPYIALYLCKSTPSGTYWVNGWKPTTAVDTNTIVQVVNQSVVTASNSATTITYDDSIPQNNEGFGVLSATITPESATNILKIEALANFTQNAVDYACMALFEDNGADALNCGWSIIPTAGYPQQAVLTHWMTAGDTNEHIFKIRIGANSGSTYFNTNQGNRKYGGVLTSSITITEIKP